MDPILRAAAIYLALLLIFRISGKRTLSQITTFDFVLLLVVGEATQQAMLGDDFSVTNGILVATALVGIDIAMSFREGEGDLVRQGCRQSAGRHLPGRTPDQ